jgi:hypothetical protein
VLKEGAGKRIADNQTVVEESGGQPFGVRFDPQRQFGQLHRQWVLVDAVEAVNRNQAAAEGLSLLLGES